MTLAFALALTGVRAQTENSKSFNKWSIDLGAGVNKPQRPFSDGYSTNTISPWTGDLGVRYMLNNKFGLKADFGYNSFTSKGSSIDFDSKYYRVDLQAVANLGRIMNFETWTNTLGLLGHAGFGYAQLRNDNYKGADEIGNFIAGVTGQIKLSNRVALTGDFSTILNASQDRTFDGAYRPGNRGFSGIVFNGTVGLNIYLGKNEKHADWIVTENNGNADISGLENKVADLEAQIKNIPAPKELVIEKQVNNPQLTNDELIKRMINDKYYSVYFDFNKTTPIDNSTAAIDVVLNYLRRNPSANLDLVGYADQVGKAEYNEKLSNIRATNVKTIFEKAGIASSRLNVIANGADTTIQKDSEEARRLARRVTFIVK